MKIAVRSCDRRLKSLGALVACLFICLSVLAACAREGHYFGIYTSRLDGSDFRLVTADRDRELNHARVSPDLRFVTFTRYNHRGLAGTATETDSYAETELMLVNSNGSCLQVLVPAKQGICNGNGSFLPNGKSIIYCSNDNADKQGREYVLELAGKKTSVVLPRPRIPSVVAMADPHAIRDSVVFTALVPTDQGMLSQLWLMRLDGSDAKCLTSPVGCLTAVGQDQPGAGDFDPGFPRMGGAPPACATSGTSNSTLSSWTLRLAPSVIFRDPAQ